MESKFWGAYHVARAARIAESGSLTFVSGFLSVRPSAEHSSNAVVVATAAPRRLPPTLSPRIRVTRRSAQSLNKQGRDKRWNIGSLADPV